MTAERAGTSQGVRAKVAGLDHVSVTTADLDASIAFYCGLLGLLVAARGDSQDEELAILMDQPGVQIRWADLDTGDGMILELIQFLSPAGTPVARSPWDPGATHIGFQVLDIGATHDRLRDAGIRVVSRPVRLTEEGSWHGAEVLYAIDPDGTWIELVERPEQVSVVHHPGEDDPGIEIVEGA